MRRVVERLESVPSKPAPSYVIWFEQLALSDVAMVGGKNASLGEMLRALGLAGVRVPTGFATTAPAWHAFVERNAIGPRIAAHLAEWRAGRATLAATGHAIRSLVLASRLPDALTDQVRTAYAMLAERMKTPDPAVAVRSSATAEDLPEASFAGQHDTFLNVRGETALLDACLRCFASLFTDRAISYRETKGFDHLAIALSVGIQQMVRSDLAGSGVMFTIDPETGFPGAATISAAWGLGETVVQGTVNPDRYAVFKPLLDRPEARPIIDKALGEKALRMIYAKQGEGETRSVPCTPAERQTFVLGDDEILELGRWAVAIERHYGVGMDIEWAKDGSDGKLYVVQARPVTVHAGASHTRFRRYRLKTAAAPLLRGAAVGTAVASGSVCVIRDPSDIALFRDGAILITSHTDPDWVPVMKRAAGIVTDRGGSTSHAAIVARELAVPAVIGTGIATTTLREGQAITLSCASGETGLVYDGMLDFDCEDIDLAAIPPTRTELMVNLAEPSAAFQWWPLPARGVGLARMEFIIGSLIRAHPMALIHPERISPEDRARIAELAQGYADPADYFIETLSRGIGRLAAPYFPHPAIVRLSDFKTNEYAHLIGGAVFEPNEENPMLGFRGACRYYDERYREGFALECRAMRKAREDMGFANVIVMVPFCRTPTEADRVLSVMAENGLTRGENGLQIYMMCEIPANVILAEAFAQRFDGFSIGSNDLTQLLLGVDRDSEVLGTLFDERDPAVMDTIAEAIRRAHKAGIKIGICGQAPSNYPEFAEFLVRERIDSISLNADSFVRTCSVIAAAEQAAGRRVP